MHGDAGRRRRLLIVGGPDVDRRLPLMAELADRFACAAAGSDPERAPRFAERGFAYASYRLTRRFNLLADARSIVELRRIVRRLRPEVVHCFDTKPCVVGRLAAALVRVPVIVGTLPGLGALYTYASPAVRRRRAVFEVLHRWSSRRSDGTVFQNRDDRDLFVGRGIVAAERAFLIPGSGVPAEPFAGGVDPAARAAIRRRLELPGDAEVVTLVTRLIRSKGVLDLARAAPLLRAERPRAEVVVVGPRDPETLDALDEGELAELRRAVRWLGERSDVAEILAASDVFAFPSYYREGVPRVLVEAALARLPIVTADSVGCREVVEHGRTGLLVEPRRPELLARAVARLLDEPGLGRRLAVAARERALERFALGPIAERHRRLYERLLARQEGAPG